MNPARSKPSGDAAIAVVGGGATGVLIALHLARASPHGAVKITLIEPSEAIGRGLAYATTDPRHLLNVRVANMSAFGDDPDHLFRWLGARGVTPATAFSFISRSLYGAYLAELAEKLLARGIVRHVRDRCVDLTEADGAVTLKLASGQKIVASWVVLATGNDPKPSLAGVPVVQPWTEGSVTGLAPDAPVLIIGSGLTMVDMVLSLDRRGHRGKITALSPRGLLSLPHRPAKPIQIAESEVPFGAELSHLMIWLRALVATLTKSEDWRSAIDALRPHTQRLWQAMSVTQKRRFLRHARAYWDVHRHRMAPEAERQILALRDLGRLEIVAGRIYSVTQSDGRIQVGIARRSRNPDMREFARIIDCRGLGDDPRQSGNTLIRALLTSGVARLDPLGIGLDVDNEFALIGASSSRSRRIRVVGPLTRAAFWESIAIPDIRTQCASLAKILVTESAGLDRLSSSM